MKKDYVFDIVKNASGSLTAEEIYDEVSKKIDINLSTVYRTLNKLVEKEVLTKQVRQDKIAYYELYNNSNKHYIICDKCNTAFPTLDCNIDRLQNKLQKETGFEIVSHNLEFHGICPTCLKSAH